MTTPPMGRLDPQALEKYAEVETGYHAVRWHEPLIYELSRPGAANDLISKAEPGIAGLVGDVAARLPDRVRRKSPPALPELSEPEIMRHYLRLSQQTFGFDSGINIGLGGSTMKYSPKVHERLVAHPGLRELHPLQPEETVQGILEIMYRLRNALCELSGMDEFSFQPRGGAHGVFANALIMRAYHRSRGEVQRNEIITCAVSHPCNAACPSAAGYKVIQLYPDSETGEIGLEQLQAAVSERTAGLMLTAPYDTGVFDRQLPDYIRVVHEAGGLVALDQANFNSVITRLRAGDIGADLMQFNLHKTFSSPHGSLGPGTGAIGVKRALRGFLPVPVVECHNGIYRLNFDFPDSIGKVATFYGVPPVVLKAYAWILGMGVQGLAATSEYAVLNNTYLIKKLTEVPGVAVSWPNRRKLQEARFTLEKLRDDTGVGTADFNQRVADYGILTYFDSHEPQIIPEPVTPEPSESATKADLDRFIEVFRCVSAEAYRDPELVKTAPHRCAIHRTDAEGLDDPARVTNTWRAYIRKTG